MANSQRFQVREPDVIHDTIEGEIILLNLDTGTYYQVKDTGVEVWHALVSGSSVDEINAQMAPRFQVPAADVERGIKAFIQDLVQEKLIIPADIAAPLPLAGAPPPPAAQTAFAAPVLLKYTDMQSLLLLDPVHDVDAQGWPTLKSPGPSA